MKIIFLLFLLSFFVITPEAIAQSHVVYSNQAGRIIDYGIGLGSAIAVVISWSRNRSVIFAIIHGILGWLYIVYYLITKNDNLNK
jgi:uncharacterized membrane protein YkgB